MRWKVMLDFLRDIFSALSHAAGDSADKEEPAPAPDVPTVDTVTGWAGEPPYRYIDVSRYQGEIDWAQVAAAGYKGAMLKTVSTNRKLSKRADGLYIDPTFETNYRTPGCRAGRGRVLLHLRHQRSDGRCRACPCAAGGLRQGADHACGGGRGRKQAQAAVHA